MVQIALAGLAVAGASWGLGTFGLEGLSVFWTGQQASSGGRGGVGVIAADGLPSYVVPAGVTHVGAERTDVYDSMEDDALGAVQLELFADPLENRVHLFWNVRANDAAPFGVSSRQVLDLGYTPTAVCAGATFGEVFLAGTANTGFTQLASYRFSVPSSSRDPVEPEIEEIFMTDLTYGTRDITHVFRSLASDSLIFVRFFDSSEVYAVDLTNGSLEKVASPLDRSVVHLPGLEHDFDFVLARDHSIAGHVYFLIAVTGPVRPFQALVDSDRDGQLDGVYLDITEEVWDQAGFGDESLYLD